MERLHSIRKVLALLLPILIVVFVFAVGMPTFSFGQVMTGTKYSIESDSVNFGGASSTSTIFSIDDTMGEISSGYSASSKYALHAGFLQDDDIFISVAVSTTSLTMDSSIGGVTGGTSNGLVNINVLTDDSAGYSLYVRAEGNPAMSSVDDSIADYAPSGANPDFVFSVPSSQSRFAYTVEGSHTVSRFKDNGATCGTGSSNASDSCWDGLSTTNSLIGLGSGNTLPSGVSTALKFRVGVGSARNQTEGLYYATSTITAIAN